MKKISVVLVSISLIGAVSFASLRTDTKQKKEVKKEMKKEQQEKKVKKQCRSICPFSI